MNLVKGKKCLFSLASNWNLEMKILEILMDATREIFYYSITVLTDNLDTVYAHYFLLYIKNLVI